MCTFVIQLRIPATLQKRFCVRLLTEYMLDSPRKGHHYHFHSQLDPNSKHTHHRCRSTPCTEFRVFLCEDRISQKKNTQTELDRYHCTKVQQLRGYRLHHFQLQHSVSRLPFRSSTFEEWGASKLKE